MIIKLNIKHVEMRKCKCNIIYVYTHTHTPIQLFITMTLNSIGYMYIIQNIIPTIDTIYRL
jgi:hypothetical protein